MRVFRLVVPAACILFVSGTLLSGCPKKPGGGGGGGPCDGFPGVCLDLSPWITTSGTGADAHKATKADLFEGSAVQGKVGDWVLENDKIRVMIQGKDRHIGPCPYGGDIVDADLVRPAGEPGREAFGELSLLMNFGRTMMVDDVRVFRDGSGGGSAVLAVTGHDTVNDFINVPVLLQGFPGGIGNLWLSPETDLGLKITSYYVLSPGAYRVRVVTVLENDSGKDELLTLGDLIDPGGWVDLFNPDRVTGSRFGYTDLLPEAADTFLGYAAQDVAYGYALVGVPGSESDPNVVLSVSGVTGSLIGAESFFDFTGNMPDPLPPGTYDVASKAQQIYVRDFYVGKDLAQVSADYGANNGVTLGEVSGTVSPPAGMDLPPRTRVAVLDTGHHVHTVFYVENGTYSGRLPEGTWTLEVDAPGHPFSATGDVTIAKGQPATLDLSAPPTAIVDLHVRDTAGNPVPAKATFVCVTTCPKNLANEGSLFRDTGFDPLPRNVQLVAFVGPTGDATLRVPPGQYDLVVSRGAEWSTFPANWPTGVYELPLAAGDTTAVDATLAHVIDTTGWISADLHVHGIDSPDSPVPNLDRVRSFLAEGADVIVGTDHDYVTDYAPYIQALNAGHFLRSVIGDEITTFEWGHFNAFPLKADTGDVNGNAVDWAGGAGPTLTPAELFAAAKAHPGAAEKVIQVNHPRGIQGYFSAIGLDTATGKTSADPATFRMPTGGVKPDDTGLFSTDFTAMEIYNGWTVSSFTTRTADWFAFLEHGLVRTATAVSDTHRWYSEAVGSPRSWVDVGAGKDTPDTFDEAALVAGINEHHLIGSNGPFLSVTATSGSKTAGIGDILSLAAPGDGVDITVTVQIPTWFSFDSIDLYANVDGTDSRPYSEQSTLPDPNESIAVDLTQETPVPGAFPGATAGTPYQRYVITRTFHEMPTADTWYVVMVRGTGSGFPVLLSANVGALAFANPIFVDADGDGVFKAPHVMQWKRPGGPKVQPRWSRPVLRRMNQSDLNWIRARMDKP